MRHDANSSSDTFYSVRNRSPSVYSGKSPDAICAARVGLSGAGPWPPTVFQSRQLWPERAPKTIAYSERCLHRSRALEDVQILEKRCRHLLAPFHGRLDGAGPKRGPWGLVPRERARWPAGGRAERRGVRQHLESVAVSAALTARQPDCC
ncbi:hypothetical protein AAFF_G00147010 [Aldrovandia affinis]|uniref:Uncharacterized protein n=1 Tax=Aldrovandia affinis TaxID=143900 RepID=A0AAD7RQ36_9TELE|nr:hypothetical protein AAFF_G00147010 [Aldrovandia affinis]